MSSVEPTTAVMNTFSMEMSIKLNVQLHAFIHLLGVNTCGKMHIWRYIKYYGRRLRDYRKIPYSLLFSLYQKFS